MAEKRPHMCGYCMTGHHGQCRGETHWYEQTWICSCDHGEDT